MYELVAYLLVTEWVNAGFNMKRKHPISLLLILLLLLKGCMQCPIFGPAQKAVGNRQLPFDETLAYKAARPERQVARATRWRRAQVVAIDCHRMRCMRAHHGDYVWDRRAVCISPLCSLTMFDRCRLTVPVMKYLEDNSGPVYHSSKCLGIHKEITSSA